MVELMDRVIGEVCQGRELGVVPEEKYGDKAHWVSTTRHWISATKSNLHRVKHHIDYPSEHLVEIPLRTSEHVMLVVLGAMRSLQAC